MAVTLGAGSTAAQSDENGSGGERRFVAIGQRVLPQGACTSPAITNILCRRLDARLVGLARRFGYTYSRYADDLVFSHPDASATLGAFLGFVQDVIASEGFIVNAKKTRVMRPQHRQTVNGLVVNAIPTDSVINATPADSATLEGRSVNDDDSAQVPASNGESLPDGAVRLSRRDLRRFRAFLRHCEAEGFDAMSARLGKDAQAYARGYLAYIHMASPARAAQFAQAHPWLRARGPRGQFT